MIFNVLKIFTKETKMQNLFGKVLSVERIKTRGNGMALECKVLIDGKINVICKIGFFCPLEQGDSILMFNREEYEDDKGRIVCSLIDSPLVMLGNDDKTIETSFFRCKSKNIDVKTMSKILFHFKKSSEMLGKKIHQVINNFTCKYIRAFFNHENKNKILLDEFSDVLDFSSNKSGTLFSDLHQIFKNWYKKRILRQYYCFGFKQFEIKIIDHFVCCNGEYLHEIFQEFLKNPYIFFTINNQRISDFCKKLEVWNEEGRKEYECLRGIYIEFEKGNNGYSSEDFILMHGQTLLSQLNRFLVERNGIVYFRYTFNLEYEVFKCIQNIRNRSPPKFNEQALQNMLESLSEDQKHAITSSLEYPLSIICGAAGTGKTTILRVIVSILEGAGYEVALASFTGKAVARIKQVLQKENAYTLHFLLKKQIPVDILIIDETSMVSMELFYYTMKNLSPHTIVYLIGDYYQLPPIEWGRPFFDLIQSHKIPLFELKTYHRFYNDNQFKEINGIIENSKGIREEQALWNISERENFKLMFNSSIKSLIQKCIEEQKSYRDFVILCPFNKLLPEINQMASDLFLKDKEEIEDNTGRKWRLGDKVIHTKNNYEIGIMNGDEGIIKNFKKENELVVAMEVQFSKQMVEFKITFDKYDDSEIQPDDLEEDIEDIGIPCSSHLTRSFALTIHKSQGSEWKYVVLFLQSGGAFGFLNRNLFYTAMTRCKEQLWIIIERNHVMQKIIQTESKFGNDYLITLCKELLPDHEEEKQEKQEQFEMLSNQSMF